MQLNVFNNLISSGNAIGFSEAGPSSDKVRMAKSSTTMEGMFSSDPFEEQYSLLDEIARSVTYGIGTMERGGGPCIDDNAGVIVEVVIRYSCCTT